jgi:hypothetical protein
MTARSASTSSACCRAARTSPSRSQHRTSASVWRSTTPARSSRCGRARRRWPRHSATPSRMTRGGWRRRPAGRTASTARGTRKRWISLTTTSAGSAASRGWRSCCGSTPVVSPFGSGLIYLTTSSRISHALSRSGYIPQQFERTLVPVFGVLFSTAIGLVFLLPFPSWSKLVGIVTSASVLMYASAPLALGAVRKSKPDLPRVYRLPAASCRSTPSIARCTTCRTPPPSAPGRGRSRAAGPRQCRSRSEPPFPDALMPHSDIHRVRFRSVASQIGR